MYFEKRAATNDARSSPDSGHSRANTAKGSSRFDDGCSDLTQSALQLLFDEIHRGRIDPIARLWRPMNAATRPVLKANSQSPVDVCQQPDRTDHEKLQIL